MVNMDCTTLKPTKEPLVSQVTKSFIYITGMTPSQSEDLWVILTEWQEESTMGKDPPPYFNRKALLITLNFLRQYPTQIQLASRWRLSRPTTDLILNYVLDLINTSQILEVTIQTLR